MSNTSPPRDAYFYSAADSGPELFVGGKSYFADLKQSLNKAKKSVLICGWSLNLKTVMDDKGTMIKDILFGLPESVDIKILIWDYIIFYVADRDPFLPFKVAARNKKNISFERFDFHPVMSSMHSKMAVVDDEVLYLGGIDIDLHRRDGPYNLARDSSRKEIDGSPYQPFRDYMFKFQGESALYFSNIFRQLWVSQKNQRSEILPGRGSPREGNVYFARTVPKFKNNPKDYSSFHLHKWLIQAAKEYIYIENQYLTSDKIVDLLINRLAERDGPEVVIVVSYGKMPVLEKISMGALLTESAKKLLKSDPWKRLKIYALKSGPNGPFVKVHSKLVLVDDTYVKIGSSNINNRSMRFDYELDVLYSGPKTMEFKSQILSTLLGTGENVETEGSLIAVFEEAKKRNGKLVELKQILQEESAFAEYKDYLPLDKKEMTFFERAGQIFVEKAALKKINSKILAGALILALIIAGALWVDVENAKDNMDRFILWLEVSNGYVLMGIFFFGYLALGSIFFPLNAYIFLCGAYFDTFEAIALAMGGAVGSASISYGVGAVFKTEVRESKIEKVNQLKRLLKKNSLKTLIFLRMVPVAPFPLVNLVCGKFGVPFSRYFTGTLLGVAPGSFVLIFMEKRLLDFLKAPDLSGFLLLAGLAALFWYGARIFRRRMSA